MRSPPCQCSLPLPPLTSQPPLSPESCHPCTRPPQEVHLGLQLRQLIVAVAAADHLNVVAALLWALSSLPLGGTLPNLMAASRLHSEFLQMPRALVPWHVTSKSRVPVHCPTGTIDSCWCRMGRKRSTKHEAQRKTRDHYRWGFEVLPIAAS